jgi:hypothetical protein
LATPRIKTGNEAMINDPDKNNMMGLGQTLFSERIFSPAMTLKTAAGIKNDLLNQLSEGIIDSKGITKRPKAGIK